MRLNFEQLETRDTPSVVLVGDVLIITGTPGNDRLSASAIGQAPSTTVGVNDNGAISIWGGVKSVVIHGGDGNDLMLIGPAVMPQGRVLPSLMFGGEGNDTLSGSAAPDQLYGEGGNDTLIGRGGADILDGGDGVNVIL